MRSDLIFKFDNPFDVYEQIVTQDPLTNQVIVSYIYLRSDNGLFIQGQGSIFFLNTRQGLPLKSAIRNAKDRNGTLVFQINGEQYDMYVTAATPQYDAFGAIVGWRHTLSTTLPRDAGAIYNKIIETIGD